MRRTARIALVTLLVASALVSLPSASSAAECTTEDRVMVTSEDGTQIVARVTKQLDPGAKVPAVLFGHGWGGNRHSTRCDGSYVTVTWDSRGFNDSGGQINLQSPDHEVKDVVALIDYIATRPDVLLDGPNDPRVGIMGGSYGGAIALNAAAFDHRIDAVVADNNSEGLLPDILPGGAWKEHHARGFYNAAIQVGARLAPELTQSLELLETTGKLTPELLEWWKERSTTRYSMNIQAPTLIQAAANDNLFPIDGALTNFANIRSAGTPVKLMVYCGGHTECPYPGGATGNPDLTGRGRFLDRRATTWLANHLLGTDEDTGAVVEWQAQDGYYYPAPGWPLPGTTMRSGRALSGRVRSGGSGGDSTHVGQPAPRSELRQGFALRGKVVTPTETGAVLGRPKVTLTGRVTSGRAAFVFLELVDFSPTGTVRTIDLQTMPVKLSGSFRKTVELHGISWRLQPGHSIGLEISGGSHQFSTGRTRNYAVELKAVTRLPVAGPDAVATPIQMEIDPNGPLLAEFGDGPDPFSPDGDGVDDTVEIRFGLARPATVTVKIRSPQGLEVRRLGGQAFPAGRSSVTWDGKDDAGQPLPAGIYSYEVLAIDSTTGAGEGAGERITLEL